MLIGGLLLLALLCFAGIKIMAARDAKTVAVTIDGEAYETYGISDEVDELLTSKKGGTNHLVIKDGEVSITEASCPDKICVQQGIIKETGQTIVCLPNKVTVTIQ